MFTAGEARRAFKEYAKQRSTGIAPQLNATKLVLTDIFTGRDTNVGLA
jgi:hypothetical protein